MDKSGTNGGLLTHGVSIATLPRDVLRDPDAPPRATWHLAPNLPAPETHAYRRGSENQTDAT